MAVLVSTILSNEFGPQVQGQSVHGINAEKRLNTQNLRPTQMPTNPGLNVTSVLHASVLQIIDGSCALFERTRPDRVFSILKLF